MENDCKPYRGPSLLYRLSYKLSHLLSVQKHKPYFVCHLGMRDIYSIVFPDYRHGRLEVRGGQMLTIEVFPSSEEKDEWMQRGGKAVTPFLRACLHPDTVWVERCTISDKEAMVYLTYLLTYNHGEPWIQGVFTYIAAFKPE